MVMYVTSLSCCANAAARVRTEVWKTHKAAELLERNVMGKENSVSPGTDLIMAGVTV